MTDPVDIRGLLLHDLPPPVALMRLMLSGVPAAEVVPRLRAMQAEAPDPRIPTLIALAEASREGLAKLERMVAAGADHHEASTAEEGIAAARAMFDRLVEVSPEASVAAYSLGDPGRLAAATAEVVEWLQAAGLLAGRPAVLDLGCGIGRFCAALAASAATVVGLEVSERMARVARGRLAGLDGVSVLLGSGRDLAPLRDGAFDLVLAVDVFPYLVAAAPSLAARHLAEAARVLRPDGSLVILNYSYRGFDADRRDLAALSGPLGFDLLRCGKAGFRQWDGAAFELRRRPIGSPAHLSRA